MGSAGDEKVTDRARIFETVLSSPGMHENCKIVLNPTRQVILVLVSLIENNADQRDKNGQNEIVSFLSVEALNDLKSIAEELLKKGGLVDFYERLKLL